MERQQKAKLLSAALRASKVGHHGQIRAVNMLKYQIGRKSPDLDDLRPIVDVLNQLVRDGRKQEFVAEMELAIVDFI